MTFFSDAAATTEIRVYSGGAGSAHGNASALATAPRAAAPAASGEPVATSGAYNADRSILGSQKQIKNDEASLRAFPVRRAAAGEAVPEAVCDIVVNGLIDPTFTLDANGEGSLTVPVPPWLPLGLPITLQGLAVNPANLAIGFTFANPMTIVFN